MISTHITSAISKWDVHVEGPGRKEERISSGFIAMLRKSFQVEKFTYNHNRMSNWFPNKIPTESENDGIQPHSPIGIHHRLFERDEI